MKILGQTFRLPLGYPPNADGSGPDKTASFASRLVHAELRSPIKASAAPKQRMQLPRASSQEVLALRSVNVKASTPDAPIRALDVEQWSKAIKDLRTDVLHAQTALEDAEGDKTWQERFRSTEGMLDLMPVYGLSNSINRAGYFLNGAPCGLVATSMRTKGVSIDALVTHPLSQGAGIALVEHAVNLSARAGLGGAVRLRAVNNAMPVYLAMGFERPDLNKNKVVLDPAASPLWTQRDGQWRFRRDADKGYVRSTGPSDGQALPSGSPS